ncbi:MAG: hypothetical protein Q4B71_02690 [Cardiobacteriaceae bacterium]|nr:hypothetical protein [Cardiobacteriaceae bacterium]
MEKWFKLMLLGWFLLVLLLLLTYSAVSKEEGAKRFEEACAKSPDGRIHVPRLLGGIRCSNASKNN